MNPYNPMGYSTTPVIGQPIMGQPMMQPMMGQPMMQPMMGQPMMQPMMPPMVQPVMPVQPMMPPMMGPMMPPVGGIRGMPGCPKCYGTGMKRSKFGVMKPCKRCMKMMAVCM